jgi:pimeloyl-ACP methyl ester carboxylesterase
VHPGFAGTPRPEWYTGIDDIALTYLQLLEQRDLRDVLVVGSSVGGWIASEMAVREHERISGTVLLNAVGIDVDGIELADFFSLTPQELIAHAFHDPAAAPDPAQLPQAAREMQAANAATLAVYARDPYMHDPKLRRRLALVPTPVAAIWGESDRIAPEPYGRAESGSVTRQIRSTAQGIAWACDVRDAATLDACRRQSNDPWSNLMAEATVVLVHGAFADASSWRGVHDRLAEAGVASLAPPNPLRGIASDADYLSSVLAQLDGPVLLVGHSYGGAVITVAGTASNVVGLVYVAAFAPDRGENLTDLQAPFAPPAAGPYFRPSPLPDGTPEFSIDRAAFREVFAADVDAAQAAFMAVSQRPLAGVAFGETVSEAAWRDRPSWAVLPTADGAINPEVHRFSNERMNATVTEVEGASHAVMVSQPAVVAGVVREALVGAPAT